MFCLRSKKKKLNFRNSVLSVCLVGGKMISNKSDQFQRPNWNGYSLFDVGSMNFHILGNFPTIV